MKLLRLGHLQKYKSQHLSQMVFMLKWCIYASDTDMIQNQR